MSHRDTNESNRAAQMLGIASIGIGMAELMAPRRIQTMLGIDDRPSHRGILQVLGVREILHGVSLLTAQPSTNHLSSGMWGRVVGDVLDTALLGIAATKTKRPSRFAAVATAVATIGMTDLFCAFKESRQS